MVGYLVKLFWLEPVLRGLATTVGTGIRLERLPYISGRGRLDIGDGVFLSGRIDIAFNDRLGGEPHLSIGAGTFIGHQCGFNLAREIRIGSHCLIATRTLFYDNDGHPLAAEARRNGASVLAEAVRPIVIGDDVWIGNSCIILKGVHIGDRAVVGAGSVVTHDVPSDTIVAGNPAVAVRRLPPPTTTVEEAGV